jgi:hypothetical protein
MGKTIQRPECNSECANDCTQISNKNAFFNCLETCNCEFIDENSGSSSIFSSLTLSFICIFFSYLLNKEQVNSASILSYFTLSNKVDDFDNEKVNSNDADNDNGNEITSAESYDEPLITKQ